MVSSGAVRDPDVIDLRDADASFGGKALGLAKLIAAGLPVPPGFAISATLFERFAVAVATGSDEPDGLDELDLDEDLMELGPLVAVRSSATVEDGAAGSAAGIFHSRVAVPADPAAVRAAIRAVWSSALTPHAVEYANRRSHEVALGVIVQRYIAGERVTVYTRDDRDELVIQRGEHVARTSRDALPVQLADHHAAVQALRAERALGVPADVELIQVSLRDDVIETWVVQARPIVQRARTAFTPPPPIILAPLQDGRVWTWNVSHNPDPLSPAQTGLVEAVEGLKLGAYELRVVGGYLYSARRESAAPRFTYERSAALVKQCRELETKLETELARARSHTTTSWGLFHALAAYRSVIQLWVGELSPRIAELRKRAGRQPSHRPSSVEVTIAAAACGAIDFAEVVRRIGALAPTWDIAVPSFGERPELLIRAIELSKPTPSARAQIEAEASQERSRSSRFHRLRRRLRAALSRVPLARWRAWINLAAIAADLAERDDLLFARAQHLVRTAMLAWADTLGIDRDDIFWLPLWSEVWKEFFDRGTDEHQPIDPIVAKRKAAAARAAAERASKWQMPLIVGGEPPASGEPLRGVGHGPRVTGRVVRFASLAAATLASPGDVIVVRAVTPALAVFVGRCGALVSETGGILDHGAALARELGITCVVGCHDAWTSLTDGQLVEVDGDAGTVTVRTIQTND